MAWSSLPILSTRPGAGRGAGWFPGAGTGTVGVARPRGPVTRHPAVRPRPSEAEPAPGPDLLAWAQRGRPEAICALRPPGYRAVSHLTSLPWRSEAFRLPPGQVHSSLFVGRSMTFFSG